MAVDTIRDTGASWAVYRELAVTGLQGIPVSEDGMADWSRMCYELTDEDLATQTEVDLALASGIQGKAQETA